MDELETHLTEALEEFPEVELAVIFGSVARGKSGRGSDVDLGVILKNPSLDLLRHVEVRVGRAAGRDVDVVSLRAAAGLRNRIAHGYGDIDFGRIRAEAKDGLPHLRAFFVAVSNAAGL